MGTDPSKAPQEGALPRVSGGFRLLRELGRGGMGVVYRAEEIGSGRHVALKVLPPDLVVSDEALERFRREARFAAAISDTHCVFVYGAHEIDGSPAISMELCGAETLEDRIRSGERIPVRTAVNWMLEIIDGLDAAHSAGVLHRDVKPSNCFVSADGRVKIGDFGLARTLERDVRLTQSGAFLGSPLYASPEQIRGRDLDLRSDLYSCGATLYALLTAQSPFRSKSMGEVLASILSEEPPKPRSIRPEIPRKLEKVVLKAMAKDPKRRYRDYARFREALLPFVSEIAPAKPGWRFIAYVVDSGVDLALGTVAVIASLALGLDAADQDPVTKEYVSSASVSLLLVLVTFLYWAVCEGLFGASFGKWVMGQRVIALSSGHASLANASLRALVFTAPSLIPIGLAQVTGDHPAVTDMKPLFVAWACTAALFVTARRRNGYRGLHELASGTRVVQTSSLFARFSRSASVPERKLARSASAPAAIGSYQIEGALGETPLGLLLKGRDPELGRTVWLQACTKGEPEIDDDRRSLARAARLRWLHGMRHEETRYEVYEDPGGSAFTDLLPARRGFKWTRALPHLASFAEELAESSARWSARPKEARCIEQVWVDRTGNLRLLDQPIGEGPFEQLSPLQLMAEVTRRMLFDARSTGETLPADLPVHAEETVRKILGLDAAPFGEVDEARRALSELASRQRPLTSRMRATQIVAGAIPSILVPITAATLWAFLAAPADTEWEARRFERLVRAQVDSPADTEDHRARDVIVARIARRSVPGEESLSDEGRAVVEAARKAHPRVTRAEAGEALEKLRASAAARGEEVEDYLAESKLGEIAMRGSILGWIALAILSAFVFRGGPVLAMFGIAIRDRRGGRASRLRCAGRAAIVWSPWLAFFAMEASPWEPSGGGFWLLLLLGVLLAYALGIAWSVWNPTRGPHDLLARTRLVPR